MKKTFALLLIVIATFSITTKSFAQNSATDEAEIANEEGASEDPDPVRKKVQQKLEQVQKNPKAFLGAITDITDSTIQIRNENGEVDQISIDENVTYVKVDDTNEELEFEDVAIGDFIIALGLLNGSDVLEAKRVLISDEIKTPPRSAFWGTVTEVDSSDFNVTTSQDEDIIVDPARGFDVRSFDGEIIDAFYNDIEEGDTVIVVGELEGNTLSARKIQITKKAGPATEE